MNGVRIAVVAAGLVVCGSAWADQFVTPLGGPSYGMVVERRQGTTGTANVPVDETNPLPVTGGGAPTGAAGSPNANVGTVQGVSGGTPVQVQGVAGGVPQPTTTTPGARTLVTLDVKTVTTGGTAVTALSATHKSAGGFIQNPPTATINLCLNELGTATGVASSGDTICITPGQTYNLTPSAGAVSVISSDSAHAFAGYGIQ